MYSCEYWKIAKFLRAAISKNICKQVLVCVCVRACVRACVCLFIRFHRESLFRLQDIWDILERYGSTMLCSVSFQMLLPNSFIYVSKNVIYIFSKDPQRRKLQWAQTGEKTAWYMVPQKYIYWYSQPPNKPTSDEKILKMRRLL